MCNKCNPGGYTPSEGTKRLIAAAIGLAVAFAIACVIQAADIVQ